MSCTIKASNGNISILADTLKVTLGDELGSKVYSETRSSVFQKKMAGSKIIDKNGEAIPMFYQDRYNLNNAEFNKSFNRGTDTIFLTDDYTKVMSNDIANSVVFVTSNNVSDVESHIIPNLSYLKSSSKGLFGSQNNISINNNKELIIFNKNDIIDVHHILDGGQEHETKKNLYAELDNEYNNDVEYKLEAEKLTDNIGMNERFIVSNSQDIEESVKLVNLGDFVMLNVDYSTYGKKVFSNKNNIFADLLRYEAHDELGNFISVLRSVESDFINKTLEIYADRDKTNVMNELVTALLSAKQYANTNISDSVNSRKAKALLDIIEKAGLTDIVNYHSDIILNKIKDKLVVNSKPDEVNARFDNIMNNLTNHTDLIRLNKKIQNDNAGIRDASVANFQITLHAALNNQYDQHKKIIAAYKNKARYEAMAEKDIAKRTKIMREYEERINDLLYGNNMNRSINALVTNNLMDAHNIQLVVEFLDELENRDTSDMNRRDRHDFAFKVNAVRDILASILDIANINELQQGLTINKDDGLTRAEISAINAEISIIKRRNRKVKDLDERYQIQQLKVSEEVLKGVPEEEARITLSALVNGIRDINIIQYQFDSLMDVDNVLAAQYKKQQTKFMIAKDREVNKHLYNMDKELRRILGSSYNNKEARVALVKSILNDDTTFISKYKKELKEYEESVMKDISKAQTAGDVALVDKLRYELDKWKFDNYDSIYTDEYIKAKFEEITPEQYAELMSFNHEIRDIKDSVASDNNGVYKPEFLTQEDKIRLSEINARKQEYIKSDASVSIYVENTSGLTSGIDNGSYYTAYTKLKDANTDLEELHAWYLRNGNMSNKFQEKYQAMLDKARIFNKDKTVNSTNSIKRKQGITAINEILNKYKDTDGIVVMTDIPANEIEELKKLQMWVDASNRGKANAYRGKMSKADILAAVDKHSSTFKYKPINTSDTAINASKNVGDEKVYTMLTGLRWIKDNMYDAPTDIYLNTKEAKKKEGEDAYNEWYELNHFNDKPISGWTKTAPININPESGNTKPKSHFTTGSRVKEEYIKDGYSATDEVMLDPKDKNINPAFANLNKQQSELLDYLNGELSDLTSHLTNTIYEHGYIMAIADATIGTEEEKDEISHKIATDTSGDKIFNIPFSGLGLLNQKKLIRIRKQAQGEYTDSYISYIKDYVRNNFNVELKGTNTIPNDPNSILTEISNLNEATSEANKEAHAKAVNLDILESLPEFIMNALNHKYKDEIEAELRLGLSTFKNAKYKSVTSQHKTKLSKITSIFSREQKEENEDKTSLLYKRYAMDMEMIFYENFTEAGKYNETLTKVKAYISLSGIGFNIFSALKNVGYGGLMMAGEASANYHFGREDINKGMAEYMRAMPKLIRELNEGNYNTIEDKTIGAMVFFNIIDTQIETELLNSKALKNPNKRKRVQARLANKIMWAGFVMQEKGESFMQNSALLAMMHSHRVIDNKIVSLEEFIGSKLGKYTVKDIRENKKLVDEIIKSNKIEVKKLQEEFKQYKSVTDSGTIVDNVWTIEGMNEEELEDFKIKVQGVNQKTHGIYNMQDKGAIENTISGQLLMQFRHWMRPGWVRRYGSRGVLKTNKSWNVRRKEYDVGSWKVVRDFLISPFSKGGMKYFLDNKDQTFANTAQAILKGYGHLMSNFKRYYNVLDRQEQAEVRRVTSELLVSTGVLLILMGLKGLDDELDKDSIKYKLLASSIYLTDALHSELIGFMPIYSWVGQGKQLLTNPVAVFSQTEKILALVGNAMAYPLRTDESRTYQGGTYYKKDKVWVGLNKITPLFNQIQRLMFIDKSSKYYKSQFFNF